MFIYTFSIISSNRNLRKIFVTLDYCICVECLTFIAFLGPVKPLLQYFFSHNLHILLKSCSLLEQVLNIIAKRYISYNHQVPAGLSTSNLQVLITFLAVVLQYIYIISSSLQRCKMCCEFLSGNTSQFNDNIERNR